MTNNYRFSWAENSEGRIVHVDDVRRGLLCDCRCPHCLEPLMARHGNKREHGFAHHSDKRGANLNICYMVILYKLAEQIIQTKKRILTPSYYGIFPEKDIEFIDVRIDSHYEREDKQPDVIAISKEGKQYLIELTFNYKVQHKEVLKYKNLTCLEIDLSNQTLESLEDFLLKSNKDRKWLNNEFYFNSIESRYAAANKCVQLFKETECMHCELYQRCCAVRKSGESSELLFIENSGQKYRLCKLDQYAVSIENYRQNMKTEKNRGDEQKEIIYPSEQSCFDCQSNLSWKNLGDGYANCGAWQSLGVPQRTSPECANNCRQFE